MPHDAIGCSRALEVKLSVVLVSTRNNLLSSCRTKWMRQFENRSLKFKSLLQKLSHITYLCNNLMNNLEHS